MITFHHLQIDLFEHHIKTSKDPYLFGQSSSIFQFSTTHHCINKDLTEHHAHLFLFDFLLRSMVIRGDGTNLFGSALSPLM
jgi:hypothetical protein